jgi:predicted restriction endonuclease
MIEKPSRIRDDKLRKNYHTMRCVVCSRHGCDPCHIKSKGAGGDDVPENMMPLCRIHHTEQHKIGWVTFAKKYPQVANWLLAHGWSIGDLKITRPVQY